MGCGGSRADAIEPRYYESWTRDTESTWLTNTDTDTPLQGITSNTSGCPENAVFTSSKENGTVYTGKGAEGKTAQTYVTVSSSVTNKEKRTVNAGTQCTITAATTTQKKRTVLQTEQLPSGNQDKYPPRKSALTLRKAGLKQADMFKRPI
ncbi:brain and acute leukemia cytoplasmic protein-like [Polyodon spathula]|uniref:brain and acute leukemia cytoplasmic protein-like n=1 Tax=Polyodon spathula TaxID=7913 RepID=UPI001B7DEECC|nr:brain and acute leukemia cytoplasmic protein-like [Polyodon spathula]